MGDAVEQLRQLPAASIDTVITSPPYYQLRDYQVPGQIGMENSVDGWVERLALVFDELARVIKPTGSIWLNVSDSFSRNRRQGALPKSLLLGPERLALALNERGWIVRSRLAWVKTNPMPSSVADRFNSTWEFVFLLTRSRQYFFDLDAVRLPHRSTAHPSAAAIGRAGASPTRRAWAGPLAGSQGGLASLKVAGRVGHPLGRNPGDVLMTASSNYRGAHFATFPVGLVRPLLIATCPERVCTKCGLPWRRAPYRLVGQLATLGRLRPACQCTAPPAAGLVLDPFMGAGTVAVVAEALGRRWCGIELNPEFVALTDERLRAARASPDAKAA